MRGIGEYFAVDSVIIRLLWVVFTLMGGAGLIAYIIAAIIVPADPSSYSAGDSYARTEDPGSGTRRSGGNSSRNTSLVLGAALVLFGGFLVIEGFYPVDAQRPVPGCSIMIGLGVFFLARKK